MGVGKGTTLANFLRGKKSCIPPMVVKVGGFCSPRIPNEEGIGGAESPRDHMESHTPAEKAE